MLAKNSNFQQPGPHAAPEQPAGQAMTSIVPQALSKVLVKKLGLTEINSKGLLGRGAGVWFCHLCSVRRSALWLLLPSGTFPLGPTQYLTLFLHNSPP